jgi:hypothetical protein
MATEKIMRSKMRHYIQTAATPVTWKQLNKGITSLTSSYNPEIEEEAYIGDDVKTKYVTMLATETAFDLLYDSADAANTYLFGIMWDRKIGSEAETYLLSVDMTDATTTGTEPDIVTTYKAVKDKVSVVYNSMGDEAVKPLKISVSLVHQGDPVFGQYEPVTGAFTPDKG